MTARQAERLDRELVRLERAYTRHGGHLRRVRGELVEYDRHRRVSPVVPDHQLRPRQLRRLVELRRVYAAAIRAGVR